MDGQTDRLKREAPVFTYRDFTSRLPPLASASDDAPPAGTASFGVATRPAVPESDRAGGQEHAGLLGGTRRTGDAGPVPDAPPEASSEPAGPAARDPGTTAAVAERPRPQAESPQRGEAKTAKLLGIGRASWYQHPGRTANGETYNPNRLTAAHHNLPFGTKLKVVNKRNGRSVVVEITDRTNEHTKIKRNYAIDLSRASARKIGMDGVDLVALYKID
ncbi:septal ring lytic transglycosylase RlpA family protein [Methylobacterium sp. J-070]|uniref:septal ring lytic transglycosylase RlpA family protein n=1 Tax=Methylobacterium sp. J-070 TaxID=2836650 RepID=UPI001FBBEE50|nr:septal ring lytic transglycosylase RlpA family protein [Methylobacterium sp. J-070]MCJ2049346.1 hypothetical protein [Methylobacterium sp. J-070]